MIVIGQKERVADFIEQRTGGKYYDYEAIGVEKNGNIVGGVLIYDYVENTRCAMSCAGDGGRWITREFLPIVFDYVFRQLQCKVVIITIESNNYKSLKLMNHIGFKESCRIKNAGTDCDLIVLEIQKKDCKYITP